VNRNAVSVLEPSASDVFDALPDEGVTGELVSALGEARRWNARITGLVAVAEKRGLARKEGYPSTTEWLMALSGEPAAVCRSKIAVAEALADMPGTRTAFAAGDLSESRVKVLAQAQALCPEQFARDEAQLVAQVASASSQQVPKVLARWKQQTDPQAAEAAVERLHGMRALHLSKNWADMVHLSGDLDPAGGLLVLQALACLSDPAHQDTRTPAQRQADALVEVCRRFLQGDQTAKRRPARVLVSIPWNMLQEGQGVVDTEAGPVGARTARRLTCDATISRVLLDPESVPVELGRATRVIPDRLRALLELRDQGCTWPGCGRPASWCDAHHLTHWADGGTTDLANLQLLCSHHHTLTHQGEWHPQRE
jgi:hypothetical protein